MRQLQSCLQSAINVLISDQVFSEEALADVIGILQDLNDSETASEALYDVVIDKAKSDPSLVVVFVESIGKVNCNLFRSSPRLTWQQLKKKREDVVQTLDANAVIDSCVEKGLITSQQCQSLMRVKQMGKSSPFVADRFLRLLEKFSEDDQGSQLAEFEKILVDKQPNVLKTLLEAGKYTLYTLASCLKQFVMSYRLAFCVFVDQNHHTNDSIETIGSGTDFGSQETASRISNKSAEISTTNTRDGK